MGTPTYEEMADCEYADWVVRGSGFERRTRGKIIDLERQAASLRFDDGSVRKFSFKVLEPVREAPPPEPEPEPEPPKYVKAPQTVRLPPPLEAPAVSQTNISANGHSELLPTNPIDDVRAYLDMGREMERKLKAALEAIPMQREELQRKLRELDELEQGIMANLSQLARPVANVKSDRRKQGGPTVGAKARNQRAVALANGYLTIEQIAKMVGVDQTLIAAALFRAERLGQLRRVKRGLYDQPKGKR